MASGVKEGGRPASPTGALTQRWSSREILTMALFLAGAVAMALISLGSGRTSLYSDGKMYLLWSRDIFTTSPTLFNNISDWVPLFPTVLWLVRSMTAGALDGLPLMLSLNFAFACAGALLARRLGRALGPGDGALLLTAFLAFPFVAYDFSYVPRADAMAMAVLLACSLAFVSRRWGAFAALCAIGLLSQKALWPLLFMLWLLAVTRRRARHWTMLLVPVPLLLYYAVRWNQGYSTFFMVERHLKVHLPEKSSSLPLFKGVEAALAQWPSPGKVGKGLVVIALAGVSLALVVWAARHWRDENADLVLALALPVLVSAAILNDDELWAAVRFGHIVAVPLAYASWKSTSWARADLSPWLLRAVSAACFVTHFVFFRFVVVPLT